MNHTCLCFPSRSWYSFTDPGGMVGWVGLRWLVGYILTGSARCCRTDTNFHFPNTILGRSRYVKGLFCCCSFYHSAQLCSRCIAMSEMSDFPSVSQTRELWYNKKTPVYFPTRRIVGGERPLLPDFGPNWSNRSFKNADFQSFSLLAPQP